MKKYLTGFIVFVAMLTSLAFKAEDSQLRGYIDDSNCASSKPASCTLETRVHCAQQCVKSGASAVLVVGARVYKISNQKAVSKYLGKNVTVFGEITDNTIRITKVTETKS